MSGRRRLPWLLLAASGCGGGSLPAQGSTWPVPTPPSWITEARLVLTNNGDDTLAYVTPEASPRLLGRIPVGNVPVELEAPHHVTASPDGRFLFVALSNFFPGSGSGPHGAHGTGTVPGSLVKLRARDHVAVGEAQVDRSPGDVIASRDGSRIYVSHYDLLRLKNQVQKGLPESEGLSAIAVVDAATMALPALRPICPTAHGMTLSADEKTLYASCTEVDELAIMDLQTFAVRRVPVGRERRPPLDPAYGPYAVVRSPADDSLWISCTRSGDLRVFDTRRGVFDESRRVVVGGVPFFGAFRKDGRTLILPHQGDEKVSIVDTAQAREVGTITLPKQACDRAHVVTIAADDRTAFLVCEGDKVKTPGTLVALDLEARAVTGFVAVGLYPDGVAMLPPLP